ncbi:hypothetical protein BKA62DRAFT_720776 [Auriculariales sp. MPI-PUGE-AT-0066]|nr:hypothetical protein BKA62DRAFT_720776 [Auriculariales sp. MPI-PUGE-AT-0066]
MVNPPPDAGLTRLSDSSSACGVKPTRCIARASSCEYRWNASSSSTSSGGTVTYIPELASVAPVVEAAAVGGTGSVRAAEDAVSDGDVGGGEEAGFVVGLRDAAARASDHRINFSCAAERLLMSIVDEFEGFRACRVSGGGIGFGSREPVLPSAARVAACFSSGLMETTGVLADRSGDSGLGAAIELSTTRIGDIGSAVRNGRGAKRSFSCSSALLCAASLRLFATFQTLQTTNAIIHATKSTGGTTMAASGTVTVTTGDVGVAAWRSLEVVVSTSARAYSRTGNGSTVCDQMPRS